MSSISEYKTYLPDYLSKYHNITNLRRFFHCLNPNHIDNNPSMMFTDKYNICKCFSCGASYDIFDLIGMDFHLDSFRDKINKVQELYLGYVPEHPKELKPVNNKIYDYTNYYNKCIKNISKSNYLQGRGISNELINKYKIGFDEERNLIVFPINRNCYFARSTINKDKLKSRGSSDIWNKHYIVNATNEDLIYVTEGIIDALSLEMIDSNIKTISINGVGNINSLIKAIKDYNFEGTIIIAFDNDNPGIKAANDLKEELTKLKVNSFSTTLISNFDRDVCTDINQALITDPQLLEKNYHYFNNAFKKIIESKKEKEGDGIYYT